MCELFAISARHPTTVCRSVGDLARRAEIGGHVDGWGLALHDGPNVRWKREPESMTTRACMHALLCQDAKSQAVIGHVRKSTRGSVRLENTQPFVRYLHGRAHSFAHNGHLADVSDLHVGRFTPEGETDSERAFCALLDRIAPLWHDGVPTLATRFRVVSELAKSLAPRGPANFVYCDGHTLFVHAHRRTQSDGVIRPPGMHLLQRRCEENQTVVLVASVPLSDEAWKPLPEGTLLVLERGWITRSVQSESGTRPVAR